MSDQRNYINRRAVDNSNTLGFPEQHWRNYCTMPTAGTKVSRAGF